MSTDFPHFDNLEDSLEVYFNRSARTGSAIYVAVLALLIAGFGMLPFVRVGVSVQADGIIRPATEKHEVVAGTSGYVDRASGGTFMHVAAGEELFRLVDEPLESRRALLHAQLEENGKWLADLSRLVGDDEQLEQLREADLGTNRYRAEYLQFLGEMSEVEVELRQTEAELGRALELAAIGLAARSEVETRRFAVERLEAARTTIIERYRGQWLTGAEVLRDEGRTLLDQLSHLADESAHHVIRAPVAGTIEEIASLSPGSFVQAGQRVAVISPSTDLVAEIYLTPRDVGLVDRGASVRLLVDAFPYNDWGYLAGRVIEMPDDYLVINDRIVFRTIVELDRTALVLPTGYRREVRKGMTLSARFMVAERTLWQLLRDDINDWINPINRPA